MRMTAPHLRIIVDDTDTAVAYQAMAGVAIGLSEQLDLDIGYRYFVAPESRVCGTGSGRAFG